MKTGKYIPLGTYNNIKIGYGTVDFKNLKSIYITLQSWLEPKHINKSEFDSTILKTRREIKTKISTLKISRFKPESIVDINIKTNGIKQDKRSFMNIELTLFVNQLFDIKTNETKNDIKELIIDIIDNCLLDKSLYNFNDKKK